MASDDAANYQKSANWTNWDNGFTLQGAPGATGAYQDITGATSPYTNSGSFRFFRLRQ